MKGALPTFLCACALSAGAAAQQPDAGDFAPLRGQWHGRLEAKREMTSRGTPEEATKTNLRAETFFDGPVALLRLDLPLPDDKTDMTGSPFDPQLGDVKVRVGFRPLKGSSYTFPSFLELTFPTADPPERGSGKYQLGAGIRVLAPFTMPFGDAAAHAPRFELQVQQTVSFGGDDARADINATKLELTLYDVWRETYTLKVKMKPNYDHVKEDDGAVGELEGGWYFARGWRTWLMLGRRLWGPQGISGTYDDKVELGLARTF